MDPSESTALGRIFFGQILQRIIFCWSNVVLRPPIYFGEKKITVLKNYEEFFLTKKCKNVGQRKYFLQIKFQANKIVFQYKKFVGKKLSTTTPNTTPFRGLRLPSDFFVLLCFCCFFLRDWNIQGTSKVSTKTRIVQTDKNILFN